MVFGIPLTQGLNIAVGAIGSDILTGMIGRFLPIPGAATPMGKILVKGVTVAVVSMIARPILGKNLANAVALGGTVSLLLDAYSQFVKPMLPGGLSDYQTEQLPMGTYESEFSLGALTAQGEPEMWKAAYA